jgi:hypothetical protein
MRHSQEDHKFKASQDYIEQSSLKKKNRKRNTIVKHFACPSPFFAILFIYLFLFIYFGQYWSLNSVLGRHSTT